MAEIDSMLYVLASKRMLAEVDKAWQQVFGQKPHLQLGNYSVTVNGTYTLTLADSFDVPKALAETRDWMDKADLDFAANRNIEHTTVHLWWVLDIALTVPATRDTPGDVDVVDVACSKRMEPVIRALLDLEYQNRCSHVSENLLGE